MAGERARGKQPLAEHELMAWIQQQFSNANLFTDHGPNVSAGANAANPHYEPSADAPRVIRDGDILLIDLWAREDNGLRLCGPDVDGVARRSRVRRRSTIWNAVRGARDAAIDLVRATAAAGEPVRGADVDDAARARDREGGLRASTSRTAPVTRSIRATFMDRGRISTIWKRAKNACSCPASPSRSSPGSTSPARSACGAR